MCNFAVASILLNLFMVVSNFSVIYSSIRLCHIIAIFTHFSLLSVFCWISVDTTNIFLGTYYVSLQTLNIIPKNTFIFYIKIAYLIELTLILS